MSFIIVSAIFFSFVLLLKSYLPWQLRANMVEKAMDPNPQAAPRENGDKLRSEALATAIHELPEGYYRSSRVVGTFIGIGLTLVATYFAFEAAAAAVSGINADIGPSENIGLFSTVWTISQPISILLFGRLSDRFGRRNFAIGANILGIIGGIVACTAKTVNTLIGAQLLLGIASGPPASYPLLTGELMSNKTKYLGTICVVFLNVIATGFGPYIGERLLVEANWRWIFYIYIMMIGIVFPPSFKEIWICAHYCSLPF